MYGRRDADAQRAVTRSEVVGGGCGGPGGGVDARRRPSWGACGDSEDPTGDVTYIQYVNDEATGIIGSVGDEFDIECPRITGPRAAGSRFIVLPDAGSIDVPQGLTLDPIGGGISGTVTAPVEGPLYITLSEGRHVRDAQLFVSIRRPDPGCANEAFSLRVAKLAPLDECDRERLGRPGVLPSRVTQGIVLRLFGAPRGWGIVVVGGPRRGALRKPTSGSRLVQVPARRGRIPKMTGGVAAPSSVKFVRMFWVRPGEKPIASVVVRVLDQRATS